MEPSNAEFPVPMAWVNNPPDRKFAISPEPPSVPVDELTLRLLLPPPAQTIASFLAAD